MSDRPSKPTENVSTAPLEAFRRLTRAAYVPPEVTSMALGATLLAGPTMICRCADTGQPPNPGPLCDNGDPPIC